MRKILIVIDMQKDFVDGALGTKEAQSTVPNVVERIKKCNSDDNEDLFYTLDTHTIDYLNTLEGKNLPVEHCIKFTSGWGLDKSVAEEIEKSYTPTEDYPFWDVSIDVRCFDKDTFGCKDFATFEPFTGKDLEITIIGLCTDICVISNALLLRAINPEARIIVDSSCCAGVSPESHKTALEAMKMCQIEVI